MLKKGVLSTAEKFYIESHSGLEVLQIAKALNRNTETIEKYIKKIKSENKKKAKEEEVIVDDAAAKPVLEKGKVSNLMGRHKGAIIMTPNASEIGDISNKNRSRQNMDNIIFKPMGDK